MVASVLPEVAPAFADVGDIGVLSADGPVTEALCVVDASGLIVMTEDGHGRRPREDMRRAFRVPDNSRKFSFSRRRLVSPRLRMLVRSPRRSPGLAAYWLRAASARLYIGIGLGFNLLSSAIAKGMAGKPKINVQFDVELGDDSPLSFIVGDYVTAGKLKYVGSWGGARAMSPR